MNNCNAICDKKLLSNSFAGLFNQNDSVDKAFYKNVRARFLQQSARYLGANLDDRQVQALCFDGYMPESKGENGAITLE